MSPRNRIRAAVAALGCALIVHGAWQMLDAEDADAAPFEGGADSTTTRLPAGVDRAPLPGPGPSSG